MFVPRYAEEDARRAVEESLSLSDVLRKLGLRTTGGNHATLKHWLAVWKISTDHFDPDRARSASLRRTATPLDEVLVEHSSYSRGSLKRRLFSEGIKQRKCELCGQGEIWRGERLALILDHINGVADDNRLENLRIACPNCAATFDTHCGRGNQRLSERECDRCGKVFSPSSGRQRFCSRACGMRAPRLRGPRPETRKVPRPSHEQLQNDLRTLSMVAVGRKYGVSDNAVRKWLRWYERERETNE